MSKEVAAAILTQIYFSHAPNEAAKLHGRSPDEPMAVQAAETIGRIYGHFLSKLDTYGGWGSPVT